MNNVKEKAPSTAATVQSASNNYQLKNNTNVSVSQEFFDLSLSLLVCERLIGEIQTAYFEDTSAPVDFNFRYETIQALLFAAGEYAWKARQCMAAVEKKVQP